MSQLPVSSSLSSATATGSSVAAAVFDDTSTACPVCLEDLYNDEDVATVIPCGRFLGCLYLNAFVRPS